MRLCGCAGSSGSMLVANTLCTFSRGAAHIYNTKMVYQKLELTIIKNPANGSFLTKVHGVCHWDGFSFMKDGSVLYTL